MNIKNIVLIRLSATLRSCTYFFGEKYYGSNKTYIITHEQGKDAGEVSEGQNGL